MYFIVDLLVMPGSRFKPLVGNSREEVSTGNTDFWNSSAYKLWSWECFGLAKTTTVGLEGGQRENASGLALLSFDKQVDEELSTEKESWVCSSQK